MLRSKKRGAQKENYQSMGIRIKISKRGLIQLALFLTVIGVATLIDLYIENNPVELENLQTSNENQMDDQARVFFVSQANTLAESGGAILPYADRGS